MTIDDFKAMLIEVQADCRKAVDALTEQAQANKGAVHVCGILLQKLAEKEKTEDANIAG